ncbi:MAG: outer membrane beta-barrel protein [Bryobacterales bacterium]
MRSRRLRLYAQSAEKPTSTEAALQAEVEALKERLRQMEELLREKLGLTDELAGDETATAQAEPEQKPAEEQEQVVAVKTAHPSTPVRTQGISGKRPAVREEVAAATTHAEPQGDIVIGPASTGGPAVTIDGLVDTYLSYNTNDPADGTNALYYTNPNSRGFGLNQAKLTVDAKGDSPVGVHTDIWFGPARLFRDGLEPGPLEDVIYLEQAYGYYQWDNGTELDAGLFGTIAGLEVAESHLNWNYTRGLLWAWNEPFRTSASSCRPPPIPSPAP